MVLPLKNRFLPRLAPASSAEGLPIERVLATARVFLTGAAVVAVHLDSTEPTRYAALAWGILITYLLWAIAVWAYLRRVETLTTFPIVVHVLDIAFPIVFMLFTAGPNSPFFSFLLFVITAAAFRWGLPNTILTSLIVSLLLIGEAILLSYGPHHWLVGEYEVNRFVIRISYTIALGALVGYLGEEEKRWRAENATVNRLLTKISSESGLRAGMESFLSELLRIFRSPRALIVLTDAESKRTYLWRMERQAGYAHSTEVEPEARRKYEFTMPADALLAKRKDGHWKFFAIGSNGHRVSIASSFDPGVALPDLTGSNAVLAASLRMGEQWNGFVLLFDPISGSRPIEELQFVQNLQKQLAPALYSVFLIRRLRSRAGAIERARVARELHDGAIQAMISIEMQVDVLRRQLHAPNSAGQVATRLEQVQELVRQQVFELRMLMHQMRPVDFRPGQVLDHMAEIVDRFRNDTGIATQFVTTLEEADIPARTARELIRILQEALVNVRKHSGATTVQVRFAAEDGCWRLGIVDNGRGFDFTGKLTLKELDAARRGPAIIKERVRGLGGDLTLRSAPGSGSELLISLPQRAYVTHG